MEVKAELVEQGNADVDMDAAAPVAVGVTPTGGKDEDVVDVEGRGVDAAPTQSSL